MVVVDNSRVVYPSHDRPMLVRRIMIQIRKIMKVMNMIFTISMSEHYSHSYYHDNPSSSYYYYYRSRGFPQPRKRFNFAVPLPLCPCTFAPSPAPRPAARRAQRRDPNRGLRRVFCLFVFSRILGLASRFFEVKTSQHATARSRTIAFE